MLKFSLIYTFTILNSNKQNVQNILRKYPNRYEKIIELICENLNYYETESAKIGVLWIIGENSHRITNSSEILQYMKQNFPSEPIQVQIQFLTTAVKTFLKSPHKKNNRKTLIDILKYCKNSSICLDLKDRAIFYWRLLAMDHQRASEIIFTKTAEIGFEQMDTDVVGKYVENISFTSSCNFNAFGD